METKQFLTKGQQKAKDRAEEPGYKPNRALRRSRFRAAVRSMWKKFGRVDNE